MPKYNSSPKSGSTEVKEEKSAKALITKNSVLSMTYFDDSEVPVTLNNPNMSDVSLQDILAEEHKESVPNKSSPRAGNGSHHNGHGDNYNNRHSVNSMSSLQSNERARTYNESLFQKLKQTPLKSQKSSRDVPGMDPFEMDLEAPLAHGGFSYYSANESNHNIPVHKNGPVGYKSTVGFADIERVPSGTYNKKRDLTERALPPVPVANGHGHTHHHDHQYHHVPQHPYSPSGAANGHRPPGPPPAPFATMPSIGPRTLQLPPENNRHSPPPNGSGSPKNGRPHSDELTASQRHENYNNQLKRLVSSFSSHSLVSVPSDYQIDEVEKVGTIRGTTDPTKRPEVLLQASSPRYHNNGRPGYTRDISDLSIDHQKGNSEKEREFQMRLGKKSLHSLERTSTHLTKLGSKVKLSQSKYFSGLYDYCIVFPYFDETQSPDAKYVIHAMIQAGLEVFPYLSIQQDELIVLFRAKLETLKDIAEKSDFKMELDPHELEQTLKRGNPELRISPLDIRHDPLITPIRPYEHIFLKFQKENDIHLYYTPPGRKDPFTRAIRLKLIYFLITAPRRFGGHDMHINNMIHEGAVLSMFPLHDMKKCNELLVECLQWNLMPWKFPYDKIKEYFGEKIALYNVFMGHYSYWLIIPAIVGLIFQIVVVATFDFSHPVLAFYSVLCTTWAILMLEFWKREEHRTALRWGMTGFVARQSDRPEFKGVTHTRSHIDGKELLYFPHRELKTRIFFSVLIILTFIIMVIGVITSIYVIRYALSAQIGTYAFIVSSFLNVLQITSFNVLYQVIAIALNDQENHRTDSMYEDSLITKIFTFQFINSYASCFFLAFIAAYLPQSPGSTGRGECGYVNCMRPLALNVAVILLARMFAKNLLDIFIPYVKCILKVRRETSGVSAEALLTPAELDYMLMEYNTTVDSIRIYADSAIQYGFTLLFVTALPVAMLFSLVNNYLKLKFHMWKILTLYQRPIPSGAENIRSWQSVFNVISVIAVATNAGIVCFTMDLLNHYSLHARLWIFIGYQWILLSMQYFSTVMVDDEPDEVRIQKQRMDCIHEKIIDKYEDEDYEEVLTYESDEDDDSGKKAETSNRAYRSRRPLRRNSTKEMTTRTLTRHSTKINAKLSMNASNSDNELVTFCSCCSCFSNKTYNNSKSTHKKIYGLSLPDVDILQYPTTDEAGVSAPRTIVERDHFNMLSLDF